MTDARHIEAQIYERLSKVIDPELGRSITDLGMIAAINAVGVTSQGDGDVPSYDVTVHVELTVEGCPLSQTITNQINGAIVSYPDAKLTPHIEVSSMSHDKLADLVAGLKAERKQNPFNKPGVKTRIFAIASGKGGVGKSSVSANLAATFAALGYDTAAIDADIYGFSLPKLFGVHTQPTNLNGMLMPVTAWGVKLISIGMFAGADRAILWRGPRLQRSLEQFLSDVWWGDPDVLLLDLAPGTGDMAISVAQALPNAELVVVTTPQPSASDVAVSGGHFMVIAGLDIAHAGAVRIDHILGLFRLWWIPSGHTPKDGAYVQYDSEIMLGILALEASRAHGVVVGEDLGVVPDHVSTSLSAHQVLGCAVEWFEQMDGKFRAPKDWREFSLASVNTHDLPPAAGYLAYEHVELRERLGLIEGSVEDFEQNARAEHKAMMVMLIVNGYLDPDLLKDEKAHEQEIVEALYRGLRGSPCKLLAASIVDGVGERRAQNQPGTNNEYPNWRIPLADGKGNVVPLEELFSNTRLLSLAKVMQGR